MRTTIPTASRRIIAGTSHRLRRDASVGGGCGRDSFESGICANGQEPKQPEIVWSRFEPTKLSPLCSTPLKILGGQQLAKLSNRESIRSGSAPGSSGSKRRRPPTLEMGSGSQRAAGRPRRHSTVFCVAASNCVRCFGSRLYRSRRFRRVTPWRSADHAGCEPRVATSAGFKTVLKGRFASSILPNLKLRRGAPIGSCR